MTHFSFPIFLLLTIAAPLSANDNEFSLEVLKVRYKAALESNSDSVKLRKPVPSAEKPQGYLRLVLRDKARVIQTVVFSRYPSRFLKAMKEKEAIAWPIEMVGKGDSNLYMAGVELAIGYSKTQYPFRKNKDDKRKMLLIELVYSAKHSFAAFYMPELDESGEAPAIAKRELFSIVPLSDDYVKREQTLILKDAFGYDHEKITALLGYTPPPDSEEIREAMEAAARDAEADE